MAVALVWAAGVAAVLVVGARTKVGPTVLELTGRHGVHLGDLVFGAFAASVAVSLTLVALRSR